MREKGNTELLLSIALALLIPIWMGIAPAWYGWYAEPGNGLWMKGVYKLLDGNALANIPICLILAFVAYRWARRIWVDCSIR